MSACGNECQTVAIRAGIRRQEVIRDGSHNHTILRDRTKLVLVTAGMRGQDGVMSQGQVETIIASYITSNPVTDGIIINGGNVRTTISSLLPAP